MSKSIETLLPSIQGGLAILALTHPAAVAWATVATAAVSYIPLTSSRAEQDRQACMLNELHGRVLQAGKKLEFFGTPEGEDLLKMAFGAACAKPGEARVKAIARVLSTFEESETYYFEACDFLGILNQRSEAEWNLLVAAYDLYPKDQIGIIKGDSVADIPAVLDWTELHKRFPNLSPIDMNAIFNSLERTGLVLKTQGYLDDKMDRYIFTNLFRKLIEAAEIPTPR